MSEKPPHISEIPMPGTGDYATWVATVNLRWLVFPSGRRVLQQGWVSSKGETKWEDVADVTWRQEHVEEGTPR